MMDLRAPSYLQLVLNRVMAEHLSQTIGDFTRMGINVQICRVLVSLYHHGQLRPGTLAYLVGLEQTSVSHLLKSMTQRGLIARERDERDNRAVAVCLTAKGRRLAIYCHEAAVKQERLLLRNLSGKEVDTLRRIVWRLDENIRGGQLKELSQQSVNGGTNTTRGAARRRATAREQDGHARPAKG
jgi:DNA-binding MarR family transcriptional regulator